MLWLGFGGQNKRVSPISWRGPWKCICYNIKAGSTLDSNLVLYSLVQDSSSLDILQPVLQPCFIILKGVGFFSSYCKTSSSIYDYCLSFSHLKQISYRYQKTAIRSPQSSHLSSLNKLVSNSLSSQGTSYSPLTIFQWLHSSLQPPFYCCSWMYIPRVHVAITSKSKSFKQTCSEKVQEKI